MACSEQQMGLIFNELLLRLCSGDLETQRVTCITEVNHGYLSRLYRGDIRESMKFLSVHMVLIGWQRGVSGGTLITLCTRSYAFKVHECMMRDA